MNCSFCWGVSRLAWDAGITRTKLRDTAIGAAFAFGFDAFGAVVFFSESLSDSRGVSIFAASCVSFSAVSFSAVTVSFGDADGSASAFAVPASLTVILSSGLVSFAVKADTVAATDVSSGASLVAALSLLVISGITRGRASIPLSTLATSLSAFSTSVSGVCNHCGGPTFKTPGTRMLIATSAIVTLTIFLSCKSKFGRSVTLLPETNTQKSKNRQHALRVSVGYSA